jgi:opacity protein-like surface antigen
MSDFVEAAGDIRPEGRRGPGHGRWSVLLVLLLAVAAGAPAVAAAADATESLRKGTFIGSLLVGGGAQNSLDGDLDMNYVSLLPRLTWVPFEPFGPSWLRGTVELGGEVWLQFFTDPVETTAEGLKGAVRYDLVNLGPWVPYIEALAGAGYKNFRPFENETKFAFVLEAGAGLTHLITPRVAITAGYRFQHLSNAGLGKRNRGINSDGGVLGISYHFP